MADTPQSGDASEGLQMEGRRSVSPTASQAQEEERFRENYTSPPPTFSYSDGTESDIFDTGNSAAASYLTLVLLVAHS